MKKASIILLTLLFFVAGAMAQSDKQKQRIVEIRELMTATLQRIESNMEIAEYAQNSLHLQLNRMQPGAGMQHYNIDMYIEDVSDEGEGVPTQDWRPYFFRVKYNIAAQTYVSDYLMNSQSGKPIFIFCKADDYDGNFQTRLYFYPNGKFCYGTQIVEDEFGKSRSIVLEEKSEATQMHLATFKRIIEWSKPSLQL